MLTAATGDPRDIEAGMEKTRAKDRVFYELLIDHAFRMYAETGDSVLEALVGRPDLDRIIRELQARAGGMLLSAGAKSLTFDAGWKDIMIEGMNVGVDAGSRPGCFILKTETHTRTVDALENVVTYRRVMVTCPRCASPLETLQPEVRWQPMLIPEIEPEEEKLRERLRLKLKASYATHAQVIREFTDYLRKQGIMLIEAEKLDTEIQKFLESIAHG